MPDIDRDLDFFLTGSFLGIFSGYPIGFAPRKWRRHDWPKASPHELSPTDSHLEAQPKIWCTREKFCSYQTLQELWKWSTYSIRPFGSIDAEQVLFCSCQIPESSSAHRGKQTEQHQPKDWQLWFMLKCFLLGQIVSTEKNAGGLFRQKGSFFPFFPFPTHFWYVLPVVGTVSLISPCSLSFLEMYL